MDWRRILVPVDGSPCCGKALDEAIRLARAGAGSLLLLHVIDELRHLTGFEPAKAYLDEALPSMRHQGERLLSQARQRALNGGVEADTVLVVAHAPRVCDHVAEQATLAGAGLIVVGSHGRRGMDRFLLGSDAEQIVRCAPVAVLVVRL